MIFSPEERHPLQSISWFVFVCKFFGLDVWMINKSSAVLSCVGFNCFIEPHQQEISVELNICHGAFTNHHTKNFRLKSQDNFQVRIYGHSQQLDALDPYWFYYTFVYWQFVLKCQFGSRNLLVLLFHFLNMYMYVLGKPSLQDASYYK